MSDLISRQAAIDDIKAMYEWHDVVTEDRLIEHMKRLPSAQPVVRCKDCKNFGGGTYCHERDDMWDENDFCSYAERKEQDDG